MAAGRGLWRVAAAGVLARTAPSWRAPAFAALAAVIIGAGAWEASARNVFGLRGIESRYETVARFAGRVLPPNAVFFAYQESGALHYYTDRPIVRFDVLTSGWFTHALDDVRERGLHPYFIVEDHEEVVFKARFQDVSPLGRLDWQPVAELDGPVRVRVFDPEDRARIERGEGVATYRLDP
ncbi:MAG: hypothetical protein R2712_07690 [Vicinamibacterales bacterium]